MAILTLTLGCGIVYSICTLLASLKALLGRVPNRAFSRGWPDIDPPMWRVAMRHLTGLISTVAWLIRWPSVTEVWCCMSLVPLLFIPFPTILNNMLEWTMYLVMGNARGTGQHDSLENGKPPLSISAQDGLPGLARNLWTAIGNLLTSLNVWRQILWNGKKPDEGVDDHNLINAAINRNNSLLCYMQSEAMTKVHCVDPDVLEGFPTEVPNSRANAVMMARCATMSYDRWHNVDQAVANWSRDTPGYKLLVAWSFDRVAVTSRLQGEVKSTLPQKMAANVKKAVGDVVSPPDAVQVLDSTSINTDVFLLEKAFTNSDGKKEIALVLAFRGTEALQTIDWISDLSQVQPPRDAMDPGVFPNGFTHQGFRDSLGLKKNLEPAEFGDPAIDGFYNSYLIYERGVERAGEGFLARKPEKASEGYFSPYTHITSYLSKYIQDAQERDNAKCKLFVTGHSLGGALAHLYSGALLLAENRDSLVCDSFEAMYTFGEPRVGGQVFVDKLTDALNRIPNTRRAPDRFLRVVNTNDIVTRIPPPLGELYQHPGHLIFIKPQFAILGRVGERIANATGAHTSTAQQPSTAAGNPPAVPDEASAPDTANGRPGEVPEARLAQNLPTNGLRNSTGAKSTKNDIPNDVSDDTKGFDQGAATLDSLRTKSGPLPSAAASSSLVPPARKPGTAAYQRDCDLAAAADDLTAEWNSQVYAPIKHLTETPDMYFEPLLLSGLLKFVVSVLLLGSHVCFTAWELVRVIDHKNSLLVWSAAAAVVAAAAAVTPLLLPGLLVLLAAVGAVAAVVAAVCLVGVAIWVFLPGLYKGVILSTVDIIKVTSKQLWISLIQQPLNQRPKLASNPLYAITRLAGVLGPAPFVLLLDVLLLPLVLVLAPVTWPALFIEPVALVALFLFMPPFIMGGLVDHSMVEYYSACVLSSHADWTPY